MATISTWPIYRFGLIVTGKGEEKHLPKLFHSLQSTHLCSFQVAERRIGQLSPITSRAREQETRIVGKIGKRVPRQDEYLALCIRGYIGNNLFDFVILIDDLEHGRRSVAQQVFNRYREALDYLLKDEQKPRAAIHFLVNMLEAYFFADANAVNHILNCSPRLQDHEGDVEKIRHPKGELKRRCENYDGIESAGEILARINVEHVLSRPDTCASLRTLFAWCVTKLEQHPKSDYFESSSLSEKFRLDDGVMWEVTQPQ